MKSPLRFDRERAAQAAALVVALASAAMIGWKRDPTRRSAPPVTPRASAAASSPTAQATAQRAPGVALRLTEQLSTAIFEAPNLTKVDEGLEHWRRMRSPWIRVPGDGQRAVQQVALVRSGGAAKIKDIGAGRVWIPDPHLWNMNDGSFDQREVILLPPPATLRFPAVKIPAAAVFETGLSTVGPNITGVEFEIAVKPAEGERVVLGTRRVEAGARTTYDDWQVDLSAWAHKVVDLELVTRAPASPITPAALWGSPVVAAPETSSFPFNVLYIVVDALRGDAVAASHDDELDAQIAAAKYAPLDAWLPKMPEVAPQLDALAKRGVAFSQAYSGATWTRPSTLAMMAGVLSSDLGLSATPLVPTPAELQRVYSQQAPFLPLLLRPFGVWTRAVVNNYYITGYAGVGVDLGFDALVDHRYGTEDTAAILKDALADLERLQQRRFFLFVNFVSPHGPYEPPPEAKAAIPGPPKAPQHEFVRLYLAEIYKDDAAIGKLLARLGELGLADNTLVVVTADHGETLSRDHTAIPFGLAAEPRASGRFQHLLTLYDETARVPLILSLPGKLPAGVRVRDPVSNLDVIPTLFDLAGLPRPSPLRGESLLPLLRGERAPERPIVVEGRGGHSLRVGRWRLVLRDAGHTRMNFKGWDGDRPVELYDLQEDPGERVEVSQQHPEIVQKLLALDKARRTSSPGQQSTTAQSAPALRLRFAGGGKQHRIRGRISARKQGEVSKLSATAIALGTEAIRKQGDDWEIDFATAEKGVVGLDLIVDPPEADVVWQLTLDNNPFPAERIYAGTLGVAARGLVSGVLGEAGRALVAAEALPWIDPEQDLGLFVSRDASDTVLELGGSDAAKKEAMGLMRSWGYVR